MQTRLHNQCKRQWKRPSGAEKFSTLTTETIRKEVTQIFDFGKDNEDKPKYEVAEDLSKFKSLDDIDTVIRSLETEMQAAARALEFERAAKLRDQIREMKRLIVLEI
jgi:excinuclease ABC subunit B